MYAGATPGLLKGIAYHESTYRQFGTLKHPAYRRAGAVATRELRDPASPKRQVIGLMMVDYSTATAWDWYENTIKGLQTLQEHLRIARVVEDRYAPSSRTYRR